MDKDTKDILEIVIFLKENMATKDEMDAGFKDVNDQLKEVNDRVISVESKVEGINKRLDVEAEERQDHNLPKRVTALEKHVGIHTNA